MADTTQTHQPSFVDIPVAEARGKAGYVREQAEKYGRANIVDETGKRIMVVHALSKEPSPFQDD
jgi:hypothetical protein